MKKDSHQRKAPEKSDDLESQVQQEGAQVHVQNLVWALIDGEISSDQQNDLQNLLTTDAEARSTYIDCIQLHVDLMYHYSDKPLLDIDKVIETPRSKVLPPDTFEMPGGGSSTVPAE